MGGIFDRFPKTLLPVAPSSDYGLGQRSHFKPLAEPLPPTRSGWIHSWFIMDRIGSRIGSKRDPRTMVKLDPSVFPNIVRHGALNYAKVL
jgi:hypothetical protein